MLVIVLGLVLIATVVVGVVVLLGRDDSGAGDGGSTEGKSAGRASSPESVQFRPVLKAEPNGCGTTAPVSANDACDEDKTLYTLGPVELDGARVTEVRAGQNEGGGPSWMVNLTLDSEGEAAFTRLTADLAAKRPPLNQIAIVVRGKVVSAPVVMEPITGGKVQITRSEFTKDDADKLVAEITR
ncbi:SecDF P1 head subdomain-containing protein [Kribbella sp. CA-293567]|uniref:SecDF P1 head subdomain-containing protein n=1 Tax=Kribbella sp. CA-293567 TaxID=3002436 RepID=UPI0022DE002E|nr:hypothetical protein [Kribbella sp. CA-293567]WBQ03527.1 hypothetical protein OX958_26570 [Kribbella sp. CA-293567]